MFEVRLDGQLFEEPIGIKALDERIYFDKELSMYLNQLDGDLTFKGDAYNYLRGIFNDSLCNKVDVEIKDLRTNETYNGVSFINDMDWNLSKRLVDVNVVSDDYVALIKNNKSIKCQLGVGLSKNEVAISSSMQDVDFFNPQVTLFITRNNCFRITSVFEELVAFMSDGELSFTSDYFSQSGVLSNPTYGFILTGNHLRTNADETPLISYEDFFSDMDKLHNLAGRIEGNTLRIEPKSYFIENAQGVTIENINEVKQELDREMFYSTVKMGSAKVADGFGYLIRLSYNGFQKESFNLQGQCNIDTELNLELKTLVTDTNIIQDIQPTANGGSDNTGYDDDIILVKTTPARATEMTQTPLDATRSYYNQFYTNAEVSERWSDNYLFSIIQLLESVEQLVFANLTSNQVQPSSTTAFFSPDDDSTPPYFDTGGDYQIGTINTLSPSVTDTVGYFEAPSDMVVSVEVDFYITGGYRFTEIWHVDNSGNVQTSPIQIDATDSFQYENVNYRRVTRNAVFYMPSGTRTFTYVGSITGSTIFSGGKLRIYELGSFGGVYKLIDQEKAISSITNFEYPIDAETWSEIRNDPFKKIRGTYVDGSFVGWIRDVKRNILQGDSQLRLNQRKTDVNDG